MIKFTYNKFKIKNNYYNLCKLYYDYYFSNFYVKTLIFYYIFKIINKLIDKLKKL